VYCCKTFVGILEFLSGIGACDGVKNRLSFSRKKKKCLAALIILLSLSDTILVLTYLLNTHGDGIFVVLSIFIV